jgi:dCMP deaminase
MQIAHATKTRSTCPRRRVGVVIVRHNTILATGYNGAPVGLPHCEAVGCLMEHGHCVRTVHAEINALLRCTAGGATLYTTSAPCRACAQAVVNAGVERLVYDQPYDDLALTDVLRHLVVERISA